MIQKNGFDFSTIMLPAKRGGGFALPDAYTWCGSVIRGEDNRYHMFASRIPLDKEWMTDSEVVRASADTPEGPYRFEEIALPRRGVQYWDGLMTHNPTIHKCGDTYLLFYTGTTYTNHDDIYAAWRNKRIGLATSKSVFGPWERKDAPILHPRVGKWDSIITSNPAPCVHEDGSVLLVYKSTTGAHDYNGDRSMDLKLGAAWADHYDGPYRRLSEHPILCDADLNINMEDGYVWLGSDGNYHMLAKIFDQGHELLGEANSGVHLVSSNGAHWNFAFPIRGYSRTIQWDDGKTITHNRLERVQPLIENGVMTHLFFASSYKADTSYDGCVVVPIEPYKI